VAIAVHGSSPEVGLWPLWCPRAPTQGWGGGGRADELNGGVTVGQEAVEGHLIGSIRFGNGGDGGGA
jgi:hypothetical protein